MEPVIKKIDVQEAAVPLKRPFKTALRTVTTAQTLIVKITASDGKVGYGEAAPTPVITGDTLPSIESAVNDVIGPKLIGKPLFDSADIKATIDQSMVHNSSPKAALNIAVNDLLAQSYGVPLYQLLGGHSDHITTDYTVSVGTIEDMITHEDDIMLPYRIKSSLGYYPSCQHRLYGESPDTLRREENVLKHFFTFL